MLIDLSLPIAISEIPNDDPSHALGHVGTHFDILEHTFPLNSFRTRGSVVDISHLRDREVEVSDIDTGDIPDGGTLIFHTGYVADIGYAKKDYNRRSANLSDELIAHLINRGIKLIGVDAAGAQKPTKHRAVDEYCAERGTFIIENLDNVPVLLKWKQQPITIFTLPLAYRGLTGLPCRVVAEVGE